MTLNVIRCPCNNPVRTTALCKRIDSCYGSTFADGNHVADLLFSPGKILRTLFTCSALIVQRCGYASRVAGIQRASLLLGLLKLNHTCDILLKEKPRYMLILHFFLDNPFGR